MIMFLSLVVVFLSVVIHEVAHGYVAYLLGDPTARDARRITLNPLAHIDPFGTIILPIILILTGGPVLAWAKPVPFNPGYFRDPKRGIMIVGAAGPAANLVLATVAALLLRLFPLGSFMALILEIVCTINVFLAVFNLIPIPPLDGSRVLTGLLPSRYVRGYLSIEPYGFMIIFGLIWLGLVRAVIVPIVAVILDLLL
ncbi:MAG: site-2 protease family protein [Lentisphaerae bacterium]|nr:site-2 protease family protein [Lentisphaerota bacterium]